MLNDLIGFWEKASDDYISNINRGYFQQININSLLNFRSLANALC